MFTRILFAALFACFTLVSQATATFHTEPVMDTETSEEGLVTLRAGTTVSVTLNEELYCENLAPGNAIDFMVRSDVTVNGKVLIAAGSIAEGMVKKIKWGCDGNCANVTITVENVQAVDGQRINLRSIPHVVRAGGKTGPAVLTIGTNLSSRVLNDVKINA